MRVFTSVFVLDGLRATFEDIEKASDPNHRYFDGNEARTPSGSRSRTCKHRSKYRAIERARGAHEHTTRSSHALRTAGYASQA